MLQIIISSINLLTVVLRKYKLLKKYVHYLSSTKKPVLPQGVGRRPPTWGKMVPRRVLPHIFPGLIIAVYFVAYNVE